MAKDLNNEQLDAMLEEEDFEERLVTLENPDGSENYYYLDMYIPLGDEVYAVLVELDQDGQFYENEEDEKAVVARVEFDKDENPLFYDTTEEEAEKVGVEYNRIIDALAEEEE